MKTIFSFILVFSLVIEVSAQSVEITPGAVLPQMTTAQRTSLANPVNGMLVYDTGTNSYWFRQNTSWVELPKGGNTSNYWELNGAAGNELKNTNSGGLWSANPSVVDVLADDISNPPTAPVNGNGTRMMWIPSRSAFRVGTVNENTKTWDADSIGMHSFAAGYNTKAKNDVSTSIGFSTSSEGIGSTTIGVFTVATGTYSTALGYNTKSYGLGSLSAGYDTQATGNYSTAFGNSVNASGNYSTALGKGTIASGNNSTSFGEETIASGTLSSAFGYKTKASGIGSFSLGDRSESSGYYSMSLGSFTEATGYYSAAFGLSTKASYFNSTVVGSYNDDSGSPVPHTAYSTDRIFEIGNGNFAIRRNAMTVLRNGYIGTADVVDPQANLHLQYAGSNNWDAHLRLQFSPTEYGNIVYDDAGFKFRAWGSSDDFFFRNNSNTTVARIYNTGNMTIAGTLTQNSDARLKTNFQSIQESSSKLSQLNGYHYNWKAEDKDQKIQTGLLAQEVQKQFPELMAEGDDGYLSVNYMGLIPHLIESQKELISQLEALQLSYDALTKQYIELSAQNSHAKTK